MGTKSYIFLGFVVLVIVGLAGWYMAYAPTTPTDEGEPSAPTVTNFEECVAAGNPVMESYPEQCRSADGQTFTRKIGLPAATSTAQAGNELEKQDLIRIDSPRPNTTVKSPLTISGEARGTWYFEATFSARLEDENGTVLAKIPVMTTEEWMTEEFVPFEAVLEFSAQGGSALGGGTSSTETGWLILEKANASGLPEHADALRIPVRFE